MTHRMILTQAERPAPCCKCRVCQTYNVVAVFRGNMVKTIRICRTCGISHRLDVEPRGPNNFAIHIVDRYSQRRMPPKGVQQ